MPKPFNRTGFGLPPANDTQVAANADNTTLPAAQPEPHVQGAAAEEAWPEHVTGPGVWDGRTLSAESIRVTLTPLQVAELISQGVAMREFGAMIHLADVTTDRFPLESFKITALRIRRELSEGETTCPPLLATAAPNSFGPPDVLRAAAAAV
jgi:hypothetical protein